jgi:hypothetical protein
MELSLFADLINVLGKVLDGVKSIANMPRAQREKYREAMDETYQLIDATLSMVIIRLGDALQMDDARSVEEIAKLDNYSEWMQAEREFRLCKSLRVAVRETESLHAQFAGQVSANDWGALVGLMQSVLATEGEVACFIGERFRQLAETARSGSESPASIRQTAAAFREALKSERHRLIQQEVELYAIV